MRVTELLSGLQICDELVRGLITQQTPSWSPVEQGPAGTLTVFSELWGNHHALGQHLPPPAHPVNTGPQGNEKLPFLLSARMLSILDLQSDIRRCPASASVVSPLGGEIRMLELPEGQLNLACQESGGQIKIGFCLGVCSALPTFSTAGEPGLQRAPQPFGPQHDFLFDGGIWLQSLSLPSCLSLIRAFFSAATLIGQ